MNPDRWYSKGDMALPTEELKRRIDAARTLRGLKQRQLADLLEADGLGKHDVGRLERGELDLRRVHLDALKRHLQMPEWWFTIQNVELPDDLPASLEERLSAIERRLGGRYEELDDASRGLAALADTPAEPDPASGSKQPPAESEDEAAQAPHRETRPNG